MTAVTYRLGPLIRAMRMDVGKSQVELCELLGTSAARLSKIERGKLRGPSVTYVTRLASVLEATSEQARLLQRVAARDVLLHRAASLGFGPSELAYLSASLDAAVVLPSTDLEVLGRGTAGQVTSRTRLMKMDGRPTFVDAGRADPTSPVASGAPASPAAPEHEEAAMQK